MGFSENLRRIRRERGISQEELAEQLKVSRQAVSKWEQGNGYPEVEKLLLLSEVLSVSLDRLMSLNTGVPPVQDREGCAQIRPVRRGRQLFLGRQ